MGRKLDALLGRNFKASSKFKTVAKLAISRIFILKNQKHVRYTYAKSDVVELLKLGRQESALLRVEHVIKDQNMMEVFVMIEDYCNILIEKVSILQKTMECPDELKEPISSLIFASSRCGEFPELQEIRAIFASRFGNELAADSVNLRNNCGVNPKIIEKLSPRRPGLESRMKVLKDIASEHGVILNLENDDHPDVAETKLDVSLKQKQKQQESYNSTKLDHPETPDDTKELSESSEQSFQIRKKYRHAVAADQEAFESAGYAAEAARDALELSTSESQKNYNNNDDDDNDDDDDSGSDHGQVTIHDSDELVHKEKIDDRSTSSSG